MSAKRKDRAATFGRFIRELREAIGISQSELATQLHIGQVFICKVENDQVLLSRRHFKQLAKILKLSQNDLEVMWLATKVYRLVHKYPFALESIKPLRELLQASNARKR